MGRVKEDKMIRPVVQDLGHLPGDRHCSTAAPPPKAFLPPPLFSPPAAFHVEVKYDVEDDDEKDGNHPYQTTCQPPASTPHKASLRPPEKNFAEFCSGRGSRTCLWSSTPVCWPPLEFDSHEHSTNGTSKNPSLFLRAATNSITYAHGWIIRVCFFSAV